MVSDRRSVETAGRVIWRYRRTNLLGSCASFATPASNENPAAFATGLSSSTAAAEGTVCKVTECPNRSSTPDSSAESNVGELKFQVPHQLPSAFEHASDLLTDESNTGLTGGQDRPRYWAKDQSVAGRHVHVIGDQPREVRFRFDVLPKRRTQLTAPVCAVSC